MSKIVNSLAAAAIAISGLFAFAGPALANTSDEYLETTFDDYYYTTDTGTLSDEAAAGIFATLFGVPFLIGCCIWLVIGGGLAYLVYSDAKKNNVPNGTLWAILTFLFGLIPLIIYFVAIKKSTNAPAA